MVRFLHDHRGNPVPSPALFTPIGDGFRRAVKRFAQATSLPVVRFTGRERKLEVMRPYLDAAQTPGLVAIGVAQEVQRVMLGADRRSDRSTAYPATASPRPTGGSPSTTSTPSTPSGARAL